MADEEQVKAIIAKAAKGEDLTDEEEKTLEGANLTFEDADD